jgi:hypothetical protein
MRYTSISPLRTYPDSAGKARRSVIWGHHMGADGSEGRGSFPLVAIDWTDSILPLPHIAQVNAAIEAAVQPVLAQLGAPPADAPTPAQLAAQGVEHLRKARDAFAAAGAPRTLHRVQLALSSALGAVRHAQLAPLREERRA